MVILTRKRIRIPECNIELYEGCDVSQGYGSDLLYTGYVAYKGYISFQVRHMLSIRPVVYYYNDPSDLRINLHDL